MKRSFFQIILFSFLVLALLGAGCSSARKRTGPMDGPPGAPERAGPPEVQGPQEAFGPPLPETGPLYGPTPKKNLALVLVLGGGGARGFCHAGVLRALAEEKIPVAATLGREVGALIAALYALDPNPNHFEWELLRFKPEFFKEDRNFLSAVMRARGKRSPIETEIRRFFGAKDLSETKLPTRVAFKLRDSGKVIVVDRGEPGIVVSGAVISEVITPATEWQGSPIAPALGLRELIDEARALNQGPVLVVDSAVAAEDASGATYTLRPDLAPFLPTDFDKRNDIVFRCKKAVLEKAGEIRALITNESTLKGMQQ